MSEESIRRTISTRFKKGQRIYNEMYDGATTIRNDKTGRKYYWIRKAKANWRMLHVHIWEQEFGKVPQGKIVVFKNKDSLDVRIENLELITLTENMRRNTIARFPIELRTTIRLVRKLERKIHEQQN